MKNIHCVELSHHNADLPTREKLFVRLNQIGGPIDQLKADNVETFVIPTCNRLALYSFSNSISQLENVFLSENISSTHLIKHSGKDAIDHLFRTAAGLESQALGEHEILGQIRREMDKALKENGLGPITNQLVGKSIHTGKRVRSETKIGQYAASLPATAIDSIKKYSNNNSKILVIGTGEMSNLLLKILTKKDTQSIYLYSRTTSRAEEIAAKYGVRVVPENQLLQAIETSDVILGATSSDDPILGPAQVSNNRRRKVFIDLGMPRNFDEKIRNAPHVKLFDLDDMKNRTQINIKQRESEVPKAKQIIEQELADFVEWYNARKVAPEISSYYRKLKEIEEVEFNKVLPKLTLDEREKEILQKYTHTILSKISKNPIKMMRQYSQSNSEGAVKIEAFKEIFDLA
ncbi:MAG: glutamyl-tRNA reductase [Cyclobacteriaceae bacterium]